MTKITQEKFMQMLKEDKEMAKRFAAYLGNTKDEKEVALKATEFAKKEGYEFDVSKQALTAEDLEAASGGRGSLSDLAHGIWDWWNQDGQGGDQGGGQGGGGQDPGYYLGQDGRYYSNDGQWVWNGYNWEPCQNYNNYY